MNTLLKCLVAGTITIASLLILGGAWMLVEHGLEPTDDDTIVTKEYLFNGDRIVLDIRQGDIDGFPQGQIRFLAPEMTSNSYITPDDPTLNRLWEIIGPHLKNMIELEKANTLLEFVQKNIHYETDYYAFDLSEYVKFPAETLYEREGDCEDMAYLLYSLYEMANLDAVIVHSQDHVSVGVNVDLTEGYYVVRALTGIRYYIAESTGNVPVGEHEIIGDYAWAFKPAPYFGYLMVGAGVIIGLLAVNLAHDIEVTEKAKRSSTKKKEVIGDAEGM